MRTAPSVRGLTLGAALACSAQAAAQPSTDAVRRALIADATTASQAGDHARAIELATRAAALRATPSLQYFLAREHLAAGHARDALALAGECVSGARADPEVHNREALLARCASVAAEAERGVARLTVLVPTPAPEGLRVTVAEPPPPPPIETLVAPTAVAPPPRPRRSVRSGASSGAGPWVLGGVGALGMVVGGVLGGIALDARAGRDAACASSTNCDADTALRLDARYRDAALGANVALIVGGATLAAAVTWWIIARVAPRTNDRVALSPAGLALRW